MREDPPGGFGLRRASGYREGCCFGALVTFGGWVSGQASEEGASTVRALPGVALERLDPVDDDLFVVVDELVADDLPRPSEHRTATGLSHPQPQRCVGHQHSDGRTDGSVVAVREEQAV